MWGFGCAPSAAPATAPTGPGAAPTSASLAPPAGTAANAGSATAPPVPTSTPGTAAAPNNAVHPVLTEPTDAASSAASPANADERRAATVERSLAASSDPARLLTHSVFLTQANNNVGCAAGGQRLSCTKLAEGPLVVTDYVTLASCKRSVLLGAGNPKPGAVSPIELGWLVATNHPGTHGARLFVPEGQHLYATQIGAWTAPSEKDLCALTWAGFQPRALPPPKTATAPDNPYR